MLERTVGCREPGTLRRLLPGSRRPLKSHRALHAGFWHHNTLDLELSPLYSALLHSLNAQDRDYELRRNTPPVMHAGLHLDFLYPFNTLSFLRQYMGWGLDKQDGRRTSIGSVRAGRRSYTSSTEDGSSEETATALASTEDAQYRLADILTAPSQISQASKEHAWPAVLPQALESHSKDSDYKKAWALYLLLNESDKNKARRELIRYLSGSRRVIDAERVIEIFEQLDKADRDVEAHAAAIRSYLSLRNLTGAISLYNDAVNNLQYPAGASDILAYMIENSFWSHAVNFWIEFQGLRDRFPQLSYNIYTAIESRSDLLNPAIELAEHVNARLETSSDPRKMVKFASKLVKNAIVNSASAGDRLRFEALLDIFQSWDIYLVTEYQHLLDKLLELKETKFAVRCYRKAHDKHEIKFTRGTLHNMLLIFCKYHSVKGIQQVMDDFFRFYKHPSSFAYRKSMAEFASQGDTETVHALFEQHLALCKLMTGQRMLRPGDMAPILHVHARRGELEEVIKYFNEIETVHGLQPDLLCWNILIDAYGKVQDSDGAFETFETLVGLGHPSADDYTFGTIMGICATRGDFERVVEVYRLSLSMNIETSASMVNCLVLAHIQNDCLLEAEKICETALRMELKGSKTRMWNALILAYGLRRDLSKVNQLLRRMSEAQLDYDQHTYSALMQALAMVGQSSRAHVILKRVMKKAGIQRTSFHYAIVMGSYLATGNFRRIYLLQKRMIERNISHSASTKLLSIKAEDHELFESGSNAERGSRALEMFQEVLSSMDQRAVSVDDQKGIHRAPRHIAYPTMIYSYVMLVLGQSNQFETAEELYEAFIKTLPQSERASPPIDVLSAIMTARHKSGDWTGVEQFWDLALSKAKQQGAPLRSLNVPSSSDVSSADGLNISSLNIKAPTIMPIHQLDLTRCLSVYMNALAAEGKAGLISAVVDGLLQDGFLLDSKNWNQYIQILAQHRYYELAFRLCEDKLMDNWTGWATIRWRQPVRNRLPIELRNKRKQSLHLRPNTHTFLYLSRAYLDLQDMATESRLSEERLDIILKTCPRTIQAINTMERTDSSLEREILRDP